MKAFKNIFCVTLGLVIIMSSLTTFFAAEETTPACLESAFRNYCNEFFADTDLDGEENKVEIHETVTIDNTVVFSADSPYIYYGKVTESIGDWEVTSYKTHTPYAIGIYAFYENSIYTLEKAVNMGLISDLTPIKSFFGKSLSSSKLTDKCIDAFLRYKNEATSDQVSIDCTAHGKIREYVIFTADIVRYDEAYPCIIAEQKIGNYLFTSSYPIGPKGNSTGLYVLCPDGTVLQAPEAYKSGLITDSELSEVAGGSIYYEKFDRYNTYDYEQIIIPLVYEKYPLDESQDILMYSEVYKHFSTHKESTPDYVLVHITSEEGYSEPSAAIIDDYVILGYSDNVPFTYDFGIFIPETNELYSFTDALNMDIEGIEKAKEHIYFYALMGDCDGDRQLTVKDATYLQKCLAGLEQYREDDIIEAFQDSDKSPVRFISDYNRDGVRNVKDVTAIQKKLANLT